MKRMSCLNHCKVIDMWYFMLDQLDAIVSNMSPNCKFVNSEVTSKLNNEWLFGLTFFIFCLYSI